MLSANPRRSLRTPLSPEQRYSPAQTSRKRPGATMTKRILVVETETIHERFWLPF
jgi:hypothetical protein